MNTTQRSRQWILKCLVITAVSLQLQTEATRPNIIIILADDMGYGDVASYNQESRIPTPNMDRLAQEGIRLTDAHSADSVCTPSRYALLTGRYCWRTRLKRAVIFNYEPPLIERGRPTLASLLKKQGFQTGMVGKWHLGLTFAVKDGRKVEFNRPLPWHPGPVPDRQVSESIDFLKPVQGGPNDLGFTYAFYTSGCSTDQEPFCFIENGNFLDMGQATYRHPAGSWRRGMASPSWTNETTDVTFTEKAIRFIDSAVSKENNSPFFLYLALSAPHSPHLIPDFAAGKSEAGVRGDMIWLVDWSVGRIMQKLEAMGISKNTVLIVTSDNGPLKGSLRPGAPEGTAEISNGHRSAGRLRGYKARIFEGGHRVPFIARWPDRFPAGAVTTDPLCLVDLPVTIAAMLKTPYPSNAGKDGINRLQTLMGVSIGNRHSGFMIHHSGNGSFAIRKGDWKLILGQGTDRVQPSEDSGYLFDVRNDPFETTDLWNRNPLIVEELFQLLKSSRIRE